MINPTNYNDSGKYPSYSFLESNFGFFFTQIVKETQLPESALKDCLDKICKIPATTKEDYKLQCNTQFFYKNKRKGGVCKIDPKSLNPFVRIHPESEFIKWISNITGLSHTSTATTIGNIIYATSSSDKSLLLNSFLNNLAVSPTYMTEDNCLRFFGMKTWRAKLPPRLKDAHVSPYSYVQWSFPNLKSEDLFRDQPTIENLSCRAGIMDKDKKVVFLHALSSSYDVRTPTIFDAGFYEQFEPGGKTKPLTKCSRLSGFEEYVHIPNNFANIQNNIYEIFNP